jgi:DtxR family Mn-dependent transcriptional regulator
MIDPRIEELLEQAYISQVEQGPAPEAFTADVTAAAAELGLVLPAGNGSVPAGDPWTLTGVGLAAARDVVRRHRLAERLLTDVLDVSPDQMEQDACVFEHVLRPGLDEKVCILLGHPPRCPHGKEIPQGECCRRAGKDPIAEVGPLSAGQVRGEGSVVYLSTRDEREIQKLMALGILPGVRIRLLRRFPSFVFQVGYSQFTVDRQLAQKIHVRWSMPGKALG